jgi:hypothetical protein
MLGNDAARGGLRTSAVRRNEAIPSAVASCILLRRSSSVILQLTTHVNLIMRLRMYGAAPSLPHTP